MICMSNPTTVEVAVKLWLSWGGDNKLHNYPSKQKLVARLTTYPVFLVIIRLVAVRMGVECRAFAC